VDLRSGIRGLSRVLSELIGKSEPVGSATTFAGLDRFPQRQLSRPPNPNRTFSLCKLPPWVSSTLYVSSFPDKVFIFSSSIFFLGRVCRVSHPRGIEAMCPPPPPPMHTDEILRLVWLESAALVRLPVQRLLFSPNEAERFFFKASSQPAPGPCRKMSCSLGSNQLFIIATVTSCLATYSTVVFSWSF